MAHDDDILLRRHRYFVCYSALSAGMAVLAAGAQYVSITALPLTSAMQPWIVWLAGEDFFLLSSIILFASQISFLFWLARSVAILRGTGAPAMTFTPRAAVIWCLVPIVNLVAQFFVLRAIWRATMRTSAAAPALVSAWAASCLTPLVAVLPSLLSGDVPITQLHYEALANVFQALSLVIQIILVVRLTRAQADVKNLVDTFA